jgi:hypothetical protein
MYYKWLSKHGHSPIAHCSWSLPTRNLNGTWTPGAWMPTITELVPCKSGYHLCRKQDLIYHCDETLYEAESRPEGYEQAIYDKDGQIIGHTTCQISFVDGINGKAIVSQARLLRRIEAWTERVARLLACDYAERVLPYYESRFPNDPRPRQAVEIARRFADNPVLVDDLIVAQSAAQDAISDARSIARASNITNEWNAAANAAWDAACAVVSALAFNPYRAIRNAVTDAAMVMLWANTSETAKNAEREWQTERLLAYLKEENS